MSASGLAAFLARLQAVQQGHLLLDKLEIYFLGIFAVLNDNDHLPLGEPTVECFWFLYQLYLARQFICHAIFPLISLKLPGPVYPPDPMLCSLWRVESLKPGIPFQ